jgi:excisionase family DNA binding protein
VLPNFDPALVPADQIPATIAIIGGWLTQLAARQMPAPAPVPQGAANDGADEWLTAPEAAKLLRCSTKTLYRKAAQMPCCRRLGRTLLFSKTGLTKWLAKQRA